MLFFGSLGLTQMCTFAITKSYNQAVSIISFLIIDFELSFDRRQKYGYSYEFDKTQ